MTIKDWVEVISIVSASWAIVSGIGAWKREFVGKRNIELAEEALASFLSIKDAITYIRNPFSTSDEGTSRKRSENENDQESEILNRGFIVVERYSKREIVFQEFNKLKYKFMSRFGTEHEKLFVDVFKITNKIFSSARMLSTHYWNRQGRVNMTESERQKHLDEMHKHEDIFWQTSDSDEISLDLNKVQKQLEDIAKKCVKENSSIFRMLSADILRKL